MSLPRKKTLNNEAFETFSKKASRIGRVDGIMVVKDGQVVFEKAFSPSTLTDKHVCYSITKTVVMLAVGFAVQEKLISVNDKISSFFQELLPEKPNNYLLDMTIEDLLTMQCGHHTLPDEEPCGNWEEYFLKYPVTYKPGTHFLYNNLSAYMISCIIHKVTGMNVSEYLTPRFFKPLGIVDYEWQKNPDGIEIGGYGLYMRIEDMAKLGMFCLQQGNWNGQQLLNKEWLQTAARKHVDTTGNHNGADWSEGYCYLMWRCIQKNAYRMDGYKGQFVIMLPDQNSVIVMTQDHTHTQSSLNLIWNELIPLLEEE